MRDDPNTGLKPNQAYDHNPQPTHVTDGKRGKRDVTQITHASNWLEIQHVRSDWLKRVAARVVARGKPQKAIERPHNDIMKGNTVNYIIQQPANNLGWVFKTPTGSEVVNNRDLECWFHRQHLCYI